jgi:Rad3-related DNA helicase
MSQKGYPQHGKRFTHYDRDAKRSSIILLASATISSLRLFSRLVGLSGSAEVEPGKQMDARQPFPTGPT